MEEHKHHAGSRHLSAAGGPGHVHREQWGARGDSTAYCWKCCLRPWFNGSWQDFSLRVFMYNHLKLLHFEVCFPSVLWKENKLFSKALILLAKLTSSQKGESPKFKKDAWTWAAYPRRLFYEAAKKCFSIFGDVNQICLTPGSFTELRNMYCIKVRSLWLL